MTRQLAIPPDKASYAVTDGSSVVETKLNGGKSARRLDVLNATSIVNVQWTVGPDGYVYLRAFFNTGTIKGSLPFTSDLVIDENVLTNHDCSFVADSMNLVSHSGATYVVGAQFEISPLDPDEDYDNSVMDIFEIYGDGYSYVFDWLERTVNVYWPPG